ncbi:pseudouridine synthase [Amniculicola lignicola CBS 123094]|uniref:Pseudouridine synthase n=1 Tax=Amniculicola lignicola CBS 123094 TaxID=1392246 RepID=A0A6A5X4Z3_9PLEO|nr:pseudouridine synthase [Amniculicola lignicola CBS 123094]
MASVSGGVWTPRKQRSGIGRQGGGPPSALASAQLPRSFLVSQRNLYQPSCIHRSFHKLSLLTRRARAERLRGMNSQAPDAGYEEWTQQQLIAKIHELEARVKARAASPENVGAGVPSTGTATAFSDGPQPKAYRKPPKRVPGAFDASKYSTRLIALKFAYLGQKYNGFEHHKNNSTPLPTVEEELWKAMMTTRLISPTPPDEQPGVYERIGRRTVEGWDRAGADVNWEGCEYSKCGRTDRGVSAFGQVIGVQVRSNRPLPQTQPPPSSNTAEEGDSIGDGTESALPDIEPGAESEPEESTPLFDDLRDELPYIQLLNRVLPPDIRVYAWCPKPPPNFSARFSCKERRYKYFFTNPCFSPSPGPLGIYQPPGTSGPESHMREGYLDIEAMRTACNSLIGLHDFRNFCKIDASKQITDFRRRIFHASIEEISPLSLPSFLKHPSLAPPSPSSKAQGDHDQEPKVYAFVLHGSAFLWHQVRSIIAIVFLIGQRLESPSLIPSLLDISTNPTRPKYEMASDAPLVLWDCIFPSPEEAEDSEVRDTGYEDRLDWVYVGYEGGREGVGRGSRAGENAGRGKWGKWGRGGVMDDVWEVWRRAKMEETLGALLLDKVASQGEANGGLDRLEEAEGGVMKGAPRVFDGGDVGRAKGTYTPVLQREKQDSVEVINERYARRKGIYPKKKPANTDHVNE